MRAQAAANRLLDSRAVDGHVDPRPFAGQAVLLGSTSYFATWLADAQPRRQPTKATPESWVSDASATPKAIVPSQLSQRAVKRSVV